jgi:surfactin synthase thioesterase subunit
MAEAPFTRLGPLVLALSEALGSEIDGRFAFFGHSMGGLIAFELARQLRREGKPLPVHLFISAKCCPGNTEELPSSELSDVQLIDILRKYEGTPEEVLQNPELMNLLLPTIRADMEVCNTYVCNPEPPLPCPITVFGGLEDHVSGRPGLEGWREYTSARFTLRMFPSGHFFLKKWEKSMLEVICQELLK